MADITPVQLLITGNTVTTLPSAAAAGGDTYTNTGKEMPEFANSTGAPISVYAAAYYDGLTVVQGRTWSVPATGRLRIKALGSIYNDPATGKVNFTYSTHTGLTLGIYYF